MEAWGGGNATTEEPTTVQDRYKDWPKKGGSDQPQPWDLGKLDLKAESLVLQDDPGKPDNVSPIVLRHERPTLVSGSADPSVHDLGRMLGELGFSNSVTEGTNPFGRVDESVMNAVHAFRDAYDVEEDPSPFGGDTPIGRRAAAEHVGPWTWEALLRAHDQEQS